MARQVHFLILVVATGLLAACGGDSATVPGTSSAGGGAGMPGGASGGGPGASTQGIGGAGSPEMVREVPGENAQGLLGQLTIYFEFDQSDISPEFNALLAAHGEYLAGAGGASVRLEGHADERGSREYNIGLGERRAQAVRRVLLLQGAATEQLSTVSYGEERPAVVGSDEEAYSLNRRVELVYR
jgi:peptidoglycan-associated lipoprotein